MLHHEPLPLYQLNGIFDTETLFADNDERSAQHNEYNEDSGLRPMQPNDVTGDSGQSPAPPDDNHADGSQELTHSNDGHGVEEIIEESVFTYTMTGFSYIMTGSLLLLMPLHTQRTGCMAGLHCHHCCVLGWSWCGEDQLDQTSTSIQ